MARIYAKLTWLSSMRNGVQAMSNSGLPNSSLPRGIPADNSSLPGEAAFNAPDTATPNFSAEPGRQNSTGNFKPFTGEAISAGAFEEENARGGSGAPSGQDPHHSSGMPLAFRQMATISIAAVLIAAALVATLLITGNKLPLCSTQPDWNQYDCRQG